jgi:purine nucleosidase
VKQKMSKKIPLLIDTDPGVDDALALLMAFADDRHEVVGLTVAAGNVGLDYTVRNALKLCEVAGREDVPVFAGAADPLVYPAEDAAHVHGRDGFGDVDLPLTARKVEAEHAALAILRLSHEYAGELLLVALGPLTNIALALKLDPTLPQRVKRFLVMGGAINGHGNILDVSACRCRRLGSHHRPWPAAS